MEHALNEAGIGKKAAWVDRASEVAVYTANKPLTRLLLLAATHDTVPDKKSAGLTKAGNSGVLPLLTHEAWTDGAMVSVEHIAPQTPTEAWDAALYEREETIDRLGNLILVPQDENSALSNASWEVKRACYKVLSATSPDEADEARDEAEQAGIQLPKAVAEATHGGVYRPLAAGVARYDETWGLDIVNDRSSRLAELAWDRLAPWVGLT